MTDIRKLAFMGLMGLVSVACSSGGSSGTGGTTGSTGGTTGHTGGTTGSGTGGTNSGTGGGGGAASACTAAPTDGIIADFAGDASIEIMGGIAAYGGNAQPTHSITGGVLNIMENNAATSAAQYVGTVLYFNSCVDASAFTGVEFMLGGTLGSGCSMQYSNNDAPHDDMTTDTKGKCTLGSACYSPQSSIATVASAAAEVMQPWIAVAGGNPAAPTDPTQLTGIQWQFTIPPAADGGSGTCTANLNISQIKFYK